jgi:hypothetical protein
MNVDPAAIDAKSIQQYAAKAHGQGVVDDAKKWSRGLSEKRQGEGEQQREEQHLQDFRPRRGGVTICVGIAWRGLRSDKDIGSGSEVKRRVSELVV